MRSPPKPVLAGALVLLGVAAWWTFGREEPDDSWLGYVEGETLYVAAPVSGRLYNRSVERGSVVAPGAPLFSLDPQSADAGVDQASAQVSVRSAEAADLAMARQRQAEIDVLRSARSAAEAAVVKARHDYDRIAALAGKGFASRSQLDAARAARDGAEAGLGEARAQIRAAELTAGRTEQIAAAQAGVASAEASLRAQRKVRADIAPMSPAKGVVEQTFFNPGEWVPANAPVVAVLPDDRRKLRFFVPENEVATIRVGQTVRFSCDDCGPPRDVRISFIAPRSEYTPPVIYSERARAKLVFMVEALLPPQAQPLPLGLPVAVRPSE